MRSRTLDLIRADIRFRCGYEHKPFTLLRALVMLRHPGLACVVRYRLQCFCYANHFAPLGWVLKWINAFFYGVQIDERARIEGGLFLGHAVAILVTDNVVIGRRCCLLHQNTLGLPPGFAPAADAGPLVVGNDVTFGGGSCAYGAISIGDWCRIGVNAVVDQSFPACASLFGVPARIVGQQVPDERANF